MYNSQHNEIYSRVLTTNLSLFTNNNYTIILQEHHKHDNNIHKILWYTVICCHKQIFFVCYTIIRKYFDNDKYKQEAMMTQK